MVSEYFKDKNVWLTGASSGIGKALACALSAKGANLILTSRDVLSLEKVKQSLHSPNNCTIFSADLSNETEVNLLADKVLKEFPKIDILINNAGISQRDYAINTSVEVDRKLMEVNYFAPVSLTKRLLPSMLESRSGHIVVISSVTGHLGTPMRSGYAASKHALHGFFDSLRAETENNGLKTTIVCPGYIKTNISLNALTGDGSPQNKMDENTGKGIDRRFVR